MKIARLETMSRETATTGGHLYNDDLYAQIEKHASVTLDIIDDIALRVNRNSPFRVFSYLHNIQRICKYDIVITGSSNLRVLFVIRKLKKRGVKLLIIHHHYEYQSYTKVSIKHYILKFIERYILQNAFCVIFADKYVINWAKNVLHDCLTNSYLLEMAVELQRKEIGEIEKSRNIVYVGSIIERKGIHLLIESLRLLGTKNYSLTLVGQCSDSRYYSSLIRKIKKYRLEKNVTFLGRVSDTELAKIFRNARFFAFPSLNEGYGLVIVEAMSYGLPVVAFDNTAMPYNITNNVNGFLVENRNVEQFANKMDILLSDEAALLELSSGAYSIYDKLHSRECFNNDVKRFVDTILCGSQYDSNRI